MNEMTPAERVTLNALRATALAKMSDADFANLETEVANKGLSNLDGWFGAQVAKAVEQVLKHPGHANQASHGGGKGGAGSSSAPASSGGGGASSRTAQSEALIKDADDGLKGATLTSRSIRNQHDLQLSGGTRDRVLVKHDEAASSLRAAKRNVDLAAKLNGSDRGSVQVNMRAAKSHAQKAKGHMAEAYKIARLDPSKSKSFKRFDDAIAKIEGAVMEGTDGGVF